MPSTNPTMDEFTQMGEAVLVVAADLAALEARVAALEAGGVQPPEPGPEPPGSGWAGDADGIQCIRAGDLADTFGLNIYINGQDGGDPNALAAQIDYLFAGTGHRPMVRTFTWGGSTAFADKLQRLIDATGCFIAPSADHYDGSHDVSGVINLIAAIDAKHFKFAEGLNEPNNAPFGPLTPAVTLAAQRQLWDAAKAQGIAVVGPSVLYSAQDQRNWWGALLDQALAVMDHVAVHLYPNHGPYSGANQLRDWTNTALLGGKDWAMTETNPACWNNQASRAAFEDTSGWHFLKGWLQGFSSGKCRAFNWFCVNDYASEFNMAQGTQNVGLFKTNASNPHNYTNQIAAFIALIADTGDTRLTFPTRKLAVTGTAGLRFEQPIEVSTGDIFLPVYKDGSTMDLPPTVETLTFASPCKLIENYPVASKGQISVHPKPLDTWHDTNSAEFNLGPELRLIRVCK